MQDTHDRERETSTNTILIFILAGAAILRIACSAEYLHTDEKAIFVNICRYFRDGTLMPIHFGYPNLFEYLSAIPTGMGALLLFILDAIPSPKDVYGLFSLHSVLPVLPIRYTSLIFGLLTIFLLFKMGRKFFDNKTALIAAAFLGFSQLHIQRSSLGLPDVTMTFFATCSLWFSLSALKTKSTRDFIFAGVFAGFAATTKYNGAFMLLALLSAHVIGLYDQNRLQAPVPWYSGRLILSLLAFSFAFLIGSPGWLFNSRVFLNVFLHGQEYAYSGHLGAFGLPYVHHFMLFWKWEKTIAILFGLGLLYSIRRHTKEDLMLMTLIALSFLYFGNLQLKRLHYLLFLYPALALLAARMFSAILTKLHSRLSWDGSFVIIASVFIWPIWDMARYAYQQFFLKDSRWIAYGWIQDNITQGSNIVVDWSYLPLILTEEIKTKWLNSENKQFFKKRLENIKTYQIVPLKPSRAWVAQVQADYLITNDFCFERFFKTPDPPPDSPLFIEHKNRKDIYTTLLYDDSRKIGWNFLKEIDTGKGPRILIYKKAPILEKLNDSN